MKKKNLIQGLNYTFTNICYFSLYMKNKKYKMINAHIRKYCVMLWNLICAAKLIQGLNIANTAVQRKKAVCANTKCSIHK